MKLKNLKQNRTAVKVIRHFAEALIFALILIIDQCTKGAVAHALSSKPGRRAEVIPGIIDFYYSENPGASFSMFEDHPNVLLIIVSAALAGLLLYLIIAHKERLSVRIPLIVILGGGLGNLIDRFRFGVVRDFIYFIPTNFAVFNLADSAITIGAFLLIAYLIISLFRDGKAKKNENGETEEIPMEKIHGVDNEELPNDDKTTDIVDAGLPNNVESAEH